MYILVAIYCISLFAINCIIVVTGYTVLHTWGQKLEYHVHLHCVVSGGGVNRGQWVKAKRSNGKFLFPRAALRKNYKAIFLRLARERKQDIAASDSQIDTAIRLSGFKNWKVYAKAPFGGPDQVLKYLGRYSHSPRWIIKVAP